MWYFSRDNLYRICYFFSKIFKKRNVNLKWFDSCRSEKKNTFSLVVKIRGQPLPDGVIQLLVVLSEHGFLRQVVEDTATQLHTGNKVSFRSIPVPYFFLEHAAN